MERILPAYPLFIIDPNFSLWSNTDNLNDSDTVFWTGEEKRAYGLVRFDGKTYCFMGRRDDCEKLKQVSVNITAFSTDYVFECDRFSLSVSFVSPLLPDRLEVMSCPTSYVDYSLESRGEMPSDFSICLCFMEEICYNQAAEVVGAVLPLNGCEAAYITRGRNLILSSSDDGISPDYGDVYVVGEESFFASLSAVDGYIRMGRVEYVNDRAEKHCIFAIMREKGGQFVVGYDDRVSIFYFGEWLKGYFFEGGRTIIDALNFSRDGYKSIIKACEEFDRRLRRDCETVGDDYYLLAAAALRQSVGAHKLVKDKDGRLLFISKECNSGGCAATADVSYPSMPLYLLYNPELVSAMMEGIYHFADMPVWRYDFAPHDIGSYPWCAGQVYNVNKKEDKYTCGLNEFLLLPRTNHLYYLYPASFDCYDGDGQMPVEECGNMLIMTAAVLIAGGSDGQARRNYAKLSKWVTYLERFGLIPDNQLCTDDFAGHLKGNVNLAIKALVGIEAFSVISDRLEKADAAREYKNKAERFAEQLNGLVGSGVMPLAYGETGSYSLKYNMLFDKLFGFDLIRPDRRADEIDFYLTRSCDYGVPLDGRATYTKADWLLWVAALSDDRETREKLYKPVVKFLRETKSRKPFGDWFDCNSGEIVHFYNRTVVGGIFAPLLSKIFK